MEEELERLKRRRMLELQRRLLKKQEQVEKPEEPSPREVLALYRLPKPRSRGFFPNDYRLNPPTPGAPLHLDPVEALPSA